MPAVEVEGIGVRYGAVQALAGVTFAVPRGALVAVVGPNGAGKSSLFRAIGGLIAHDGRVAIGGRLCEAREDRMAAALIPQRSGIDPAFPITAREVVLLGRRRFLRMGRRPRTEDRAAAMAAMADVGVADLADRPIGALSGGQLQRVLLARAIAQEADVMLLDEALSGVDAPATEGLLTLFGRLAARGTTLLISTHDLALARRRFDRCLALNGRLVGDGPPALALTEAAVEATFGSGPLPAPAGWA
jgi:ABC-type Mn2+/Zn2+ transport system ATPase subunit